MTKTATDARRCVLPAAGAGTALTAMLFASRLPITLDFILPRRSGWLLFAFAHEALSRTGERRAFTISVLILLIGAIARFLWLVSSVVRGQKWTIPQFLTRGFRLALIALMFRWSFAIWLEVSQKVWFPFGSLNVVEPIVNFVFCALFVFFVMSTSLACLAPRPRPLPPVLLLWAAANGLAAIIAFSLYGAWSASPVFVGNRRLFVVLTEEAGRPGQAAYDLPLSSQPRLLFGVKRLESLRSLYEAQAKLMDPEGLRNALMLGVKYNDNLARTLLLEHLAVAPPSPEALGALGVLADETTHRIGAMGSSRIALAYAHLGDSAQASVWAKRGSQEPHGIPAGLLDLSGGGALVPGRITGRVEGLRPLKIALYRKNDPAAPYLLDAAGLVASTEPDAKGRYSFSGLPAGRYYLALAFAPVSGGISVSGQRGDLTLSTRKPSLELPALKIALASR